jgi:uncharacterized cupredoxin-like copper-binding protein
VHRFLATFLAAAAAITALAASTAFAAGGGPVAVTLKEFKVVPAPKSVTAGKVVFTVKNVGKVAHEMVVVKTNKAPGSLAGSGSEASEVVTVGKVQSLKSGKTAKLTLTLKAGKYVLLCNLPGHYKAGQYTAFVVK